MLKELTMRSLLTVLLLIASALSATAGDYRYYYDGNGNNAGSSMPAGQNTFYYDSQGNNVGTAMKAGKNTF